MDYKTLKHSIELFEGESGYFELQVNDDGSLTLMGAQGHDGVYYNLFYKECFYFIIKIIETMIRGFLQKILVKRIN